VLSLLLQNVSGPVGALFSGHSAKASLLLLLLMSTLADCAECSLSLSVNIHVIHWTLL